MSFTLFFSLLPLAGEGLGMRVHRFAFALNETPSPPTPLPQAGEGRKTVLTYLTLSSSTLKTNVSFGPITSPAPASP